MVKVPFGKQRSPVETVTTAEDIDDVPIKTIEEEINVDSDVDEVIERSRSGKPQEGDEDFTAPPTVELEGQSYYLDGILKSNLDILKAKIKKDWDFLFVIDGKEGAGKSVFAQQIAYFVSNGNFNINHICFTPEDFTKAVLSADKYQAIIFDEAFRGMDSRSAMSATNKALKGMLQEIRQKNLFIFIVLPSIWDLDKYVALHRCQGLFHVYTDRRMNRGYFRFYKNNSIKYMMANRSKLLYRHPLDCSFYGRFTNFSVIDREEYKRKKLESLSAYKEEETNDFESGNRKLISALCFYMTWLARYKYVFMMEHANIEKLFNKYRLTSFATAHVPCSMAVVESSYSRKHKKELLNLANKFFKSEESSFEDLDSDSTEKNDENQDGAYTE